MNLETGAYINFNDSISNKISSIHKIFGSIKYKYKNENNKSLLMLKIRPQFFENKFHSIKYGFNGEYIFNTENILWKSKLSLSQYNYNLFPPNLYYTIFSFLNLLEFYIRNDFHVNLLAGYSYQEISYKNTINSDYFYLSTSVKNIINKYSFLGLGVYAQRFITESEFNYNSNMLTSRGWKYGPQFKIHYLRKFLLEAEYKFLIHNSNNTVYPSYEHNINLLSGVIAGKKFSLFLLVELYFVRTKLKPEFSERDPIYFTPTQNENQIYIKSSYKIKNKISLYSKIGYFHENLYLNAYKLDGLNLLIGVEIIN